MLLGGDEFGRSQNGNNNAYAQDTPVSWFDWSVATSAAGEEQRNFVIKLIRLRREFNTLRSSYYQHGRLEPIPQVRDVEWFDENGDIMRGEDWQNPEGRLLCLRRSMRLDDARAEATLILTNNTDTAHAFQLPDPTFDWWLRLNTEDPRRADAEVRASSVELAPHSVQLLTAIVSLNAVLSI